jgi:NAD(P)-dependent dehydrogenase (short-subunit alcohol dehydrogenase family)
MENSENAITGQRIGVITGATSGIGKAAAFQLCRVDMQLILISRNELKGRTVINEIRKIHGKDKATFIQADIANFAEVRQAAIQIKKQYPRIDILINNAGARFNTFKSITDGIELTFATNHLGHFLLTDLLLEPLKASPAGRIITVSSDAHYGYHADFDYIYNEKSYDRKAAYGRSKLANLMFTYELARRLADTKITANALHPGGVATNLGKNNGIMSLARHYVYYILKRQLISPSKAAETITYLALSDEVQGVTGKYIYNKQYIQSSDVSHDKFAAKKLWDYSERLVNEKSPSFL